MVSKIQNESFIHIQLQQQQQHQINAELMVYDEESKRSLSNLLSQKQKTNSIDDLHKEITKRVRKQSKLEDVDNCFDFLERSKIKYQRLKIDIDVLKPQKLHKVKRKSTKEKQLLIDTLFNSSKSKEFE